VGDGGGGTVATEEEIGLGGRKLWAGHKFIWATKHGGLNAGRTGCDAGRVR
jgi:hypothetical protein